MSNNNVQITGHVGQDPSITEFESGTTVTKFSVAVKNYKDGDKPLWIEVQAWNDLGSRAAEFIKKGREVVINGRLDYQEFTDSTGAKVKKHLVNMTTFHLCGKKPDA